MKNLWNWFITSSADPKKTSLAAKGAMILFGSQAVRLFDTACSFGLGCLGIDSSTVNSFAEGTEAFVYGALVIIGILTMIVGGIRKIYYSRWSARE